MPCLEAFWEEAALPSGVRGPVESWALARLASSCAVETVLLDIVIPYPADLSGFRINTACVWNWVEAWC